jgi:membrane associated rhomboid family serine protease
MRERQFGYTIEAVIYPVLLVVVMWLVYWADHLFPMVHFYKWGIKPTDISTLKGVLFMPLIHAKNEVEHIVNNSLPTLILFGTIIYYYRNIALKIFLVSWFATGIGLWLFAENTNSFHIGMSGVIYAMAGFLFTSGIIRKYRPLQGISLFVAFIYGSMIWGIFPMQEHVSWEGHLSGLIVGVILAILYRKQGPQAPKYLYEIEKEMGIEPPDLEGEWRAKVAEQKRREEELELLRKGEHPEQLKQRHQESPDPLRVIYHYREPKPKSDSKPEQKDGNDQQ